LTELVLRPGCSAPPGLTIEARAARLRARSLMIATPVARNPVWQYTASFGATIMALMERGIPVAFEFVVGNSNVARARNELVAKFLASPATDLLFADDDMEWRPEAILNLLASDKPLIGAVGRMRCDGPNSDPAVWCCRWFPSPDGALEQDATGAVKVPGFGAALMLVNRAVFDAMIAAHPEWKRPGAPDWPEEIRAHYYEFFRFNHDGEAKEMGEDYVFCYRWRALGGDAFIRPDVVLGHVGSFTFRGAVEEILTPITSEDAA
jgi:hypothetical protein